MTKGNFTRLQYTIEAALFCCLTFPSFCARVVYVSHLRCVSSASFPGFPVIQPTSRLSLNFRLTQQT